MPFNGASEFTWQAFDSYCMLVGINVGHLIAHVTTQNCLVEYFTKHLWLVTWPMLMRSKLSNSTWGHDILHATTLVPLRLSAYLKYSLLQLILGSQPNISYLYVFSGSLQVSIVSPYSSKMDSQCQLGIYTGFDSPFIIHYLKPLTREVFITRFANNHFD